MYPVSTNTAKGTDSATWKISKVMRLSHQPVTQSSMNVKTDSLITTIGTRMVWIGMLSPIAK